MRDEVWGSKSSVWEKVEGVGVREKARERERGRGVIWPKNQCKHGIKYAILFHHAHTNLGMLLHFDSVIKGKRSHTCNKQANEQSEKHIKQTVLSLRSGTFAASCFLSLQLYFLCLGFIQGRVLHAGQQLSWPAVSVAVCVSLCLWEYVCVLQTQPGVNTSTMPFKDIWRVKQSLLSPWDLTGRCSGEAKNTATIII